MAVNGSGIDGHDGDASGWMDRWVCVHVRMNGRFGVWLSE